MRWRHNFPVGWLALFATLALLAPALLLVPTAMRDPVPWQRLGTSERRSGPCPRLSPR